MIYGSTVLVWAVGSLQGYTNRVDLLCATVDCEAGTVNPIEVEQAQKLIRAMVAFKDEYRSVNCRHRSVEDKG